MKKICLFLLILIMSVTLPAVKSINLSGSASSLILMEKTSRRVLYGSNINTRYLTASICKILTAIVAIENADLEEYVTVTKKTTEQVGSSIYLKAGDKIKLKDLLYGLLLRSGNDAAYLIAETVGHGYDNFIRMMNETAKKIGMKSSTFQNPSGLDEETRNYSTAYDMALLMCYCLENKIFVEIDGTKNYMSKTFDGQTLYFLNKHRLVQRYDYITGGKTGYTVEAKRTLVTSAKKDGMELVAVTFNCGDDWNVHQNLFNYGYNNYSLITLMKKQVIDVGDVIYKYTPVLNADVCYPFREDEISHVKCVIYLLNNPGNSEVIGNLIVYYDEKELLKVNIYRYY